MTAESERHAAAAHAAGLVEDGMRVGLGTERPSLRSSRCWRIAACACGASPRRSDGSCRERRGTGRGAVRGADRVGYRDRRSRSDRARALADQRRRPRAHAREDRRRGGSSVRGHRLAREAGAAADAARPARAARVWPRVHPAASWSGSSSRWSAEPDGGIIADWTGDFDDPAELARWLDADPGVIAHGLFPPSLVTDVVVASGQGVEHSRFPRPDRRQFGL